MYKEFCKKSAVLMLAMALLFVSCGNKAETAEAVISENSQEVILEKEVPETGENPPEEMFSKEYDIPMPEKEICEINNMKYVVDPKVELVTVLAVLGDSKDDMLYKGQCEYRDKINSYFRDFKDHKAVNNFKMLHFTSMSKYFSHLNDKFIPVYTNVDYGDIFNVKNNTMDYQLLRYVYGYEYFWDGILESIKDFCYKSNYSEFFEQNRDFYKKCMDEVTANGEEMRIVDWTEDYYNISRASYTTIVQPMLGRAHAMEIPRSDGNSDSYSYTTHLYYEKSPTILLHEISHSYVNPMTARYPKEVWHYNQLMDLIEDDFRNLGYEFWEEVINEHIIEAVVSRFVKDKTPDKYEDYISRMEGMGMKFIRPLSEKLGEFEENRDKYIGLEDFYTELLTCLNSYLPQGLTA